MEEPTDVEVMGKATRHGARKHQHALSLCYYGGAIPSSLSVVRGSLTGYEADAKLNYVTRGAKMQVVDHAVVTAHE
jgi:hypothetical protein